MVAGTACRLNTKGRRVESQVGTGIRKGDRRKTDPKEVETANY